MKENYIRKEIKTHGKCKINDNSLSYNNYYYGKIVLMCPKCYNVIHLDYYHNMYEEIELRDDITEFELYNETIAYSCNCPNCDNTEVDYIVLDDTIADTISKLNKLGYKTRYCCESHNDIDIVKRPYVMFNDLSLLKVLNKYPLPKNWSISYLIIKNNPSTITIDSFVNDDNTKEIALESLDKWVDSLPKNEVKVCDSPINKSVKKLEEYLLTHIRDIYKTFDRCHDERHFDEVYNMSKKLLLRTFNNDHELLRKLAIVMVSAAYHDVGRMINDKTHEYYSSKILQNDRVLKKLLSDIFEDGDCLNTIIKIIDTSILEHRSSTGFTTSIYSDILKDADKSSLLDKDRAVYRLCCYYIDKLWDGKDANDIYKDRIEFIKGKFTYRPYTRAAKELYGESHVIEVSNEDIINMTNKILSGEI